MKIYASVCILVLLFQLAVCSRNSFTEEEFSHCCFSYLQKRIPFRLLADFYKTSNQCSVPAIVFITKKGRHICANPTDQWVQEYVSILMQSSEEQRWSRFQ